MTHARPTILVRAMLALLLALAAWLPAQAQQSGGNNMRVTLVADGPPMPGQTWTLALHFVPKTSEWHGYWKNPGDAGAGMRLDWRLPQGWTAGEPLYPVPKTLVIADLMNHVFEGEHTVLVPVSVPANAAVANPAPIGLEIDYLACTDQICVPERAKLSIDPSAAVRDPRFDRWRAQIAPLLDQPARYAIAGRLLRVAIPLPASLPVAAPHVFIENRDLVNYAGAQAFSRVGDQLIAEVPLAEEATDPGELRGILALGDGNGIRFGGTAGSVPANGEPVGTAVGGGAVPTFWLALLGALAGGLLLNVMPCVFPILSLKAMALARAGGEESGARRDGLAYAGGVILACLALGGLLPLLKAGGEQVGWAFQLQEPGVVVGLLVQATAITENFLGMFEIPSLSVSGSGAGGGSFLTGLLAAFVATPCTGPFMAAAMGAALLLPWPQALALFAALGLGLAMPFLLLGFVPPLRRLIPRPGPWMARFQRLMAIPMGLTALALVWLCWRLGGAAFAAGAVVVAGLAVLVLITLWGQHSARRTVSLAALGLAMVVAGVGLPRVYERPSRVGEGGMLDSKPFSEAALASAQAIGKPVFVYFTADWCLTCKVNEGAAIERAATRDAFRKAGVTVLVGDWTQRDEAITRFLTAQGAAGVPLYLWYPAGGAAPRQLPQVLTPSLLEELARGTG